jgi:chemotaxis signal transduction protein
VQYLQVFCQQFSLLVETGVIEEVVPMTAVNDAVVDWRGQRLDIIDLTALLTGEQSDANRDCLIFKSDVSAEALKPRFYAISVGGVSNIESIKETEFVDIPSLDFHYNQYFNKAYIHPKTKQCIYRLKRDAFEKLENTA